MIKTILKKKHIDKLSKYGLDANHLKQCTIFRFAPGETIYQEDFPITWLGIVVDGKAKVCCSSANGKNLVLCYFVSTGTIGGIGHPPRFAPRIARAEKTWAESEHRNSYHKEVNNEDVHHFCSMFACVIKHLH